MNVELTTKRAQQLETLPYHVQERINTEHERFNELVGYIVDSTVPDARPRRVYEALCRAICESQGGTPSAVQGDATGDVVDQIRVYLTGIMAADYDYPVRLLSFLGNVDERTIARRITAYMHVRRFDPISDYIRTWKQRTRESLGFDPESQDTAPNGTREITKLGA